MGYLLKSIEDTNDGFFKIRLVPSSECVVKIHISDIDNLLDCLPKNSFTKPFEIQMKEIKEEEVCSRAITYKYYIKFFDTQDWIPCKIENN